MGLEQVTSMQDLTEHMRPAWGRVSLISGYSWQTNKYWQHIKPIIKTCSSVLYCPRTNIFLSQTHKQIVSFVKPVIKGASMWNDTLWGALKVRGQTDRSTKRINHVQSLQTVDKEWWGKKSTHARPPSLHIHPVKLITHNPLVFCIVASYRLPVGCKFSLTTQVRFSVKARWCSWTWQPVGRTAYL